MEDYVFKKYNNFCIWIRESLYATLPDRQWRDLCRSFFTEHRKETVIKEGTYKTIYKSSVQDTPALVKIYRNPGFLRQTKTIFAPSRAKREFQAAAYIQRKGIPTAEPVLMAEKKKWGMVQEGLVVLRFIENAQELRDFLFYEKNIPFAEKRDLIAEFGRLTGRIFQNKIFQYDYALNNFLIRKADGRYQFCFIDFEKVEIEREPSREQKLDILARLNRVGRDVSVRDRLIFVKGYMEADPGIAKDVHSFAGELQKQTVAALKHDLSRCRLTSIYTHARYNRIQQQGFTGLYKKGYTPEDILSIISDIPAGTGHRDVSLRFGASDIPLRAVQFPARKAGKIWSTISALIIAGAPLELPPVLIEEDSRGFILFCLSGFEQFSLFLSSGSSCYNFIKTRLPEEFEVIKNLFLKYGLTEELCRERSTL